MKECSLYLLISSLRTWSLQFSDWILLYQSIQMMCGRSISGKKVKNSGVVVNIFRNPVATTSQGTTPMRLQIAYLSSCKMSILKKVSNQERKNWSFPPCYHSTLHMGEFIRYWPDTPVINGPCASLEMTFHKQGQKRSAHIGLSSLLLYKE